jgi:hypothetical protein
MLTRFAKASLKARSGIFPRHSFLGATMFSNTKDGEQNIRVHSPILKDMYERAGAKKTEELLEKQQHEEVSTEDEGIHPDWLAMERRVKFRKPRPKTGMNHR